ncbi:MAG: hypothetical protein KDD62_00590, partial [Bdellovibrionales bacterium]|nr:hypothetical protein [Bdellovibrionales bacterium]
LVENLFLEKDRRGYLAGLALQQVETDLSDEQRDAVYLAVANAYENVRVNGGAVSLEAQVQQELAAQESLSEEIIAQIDVAKAIEDAQELEDRGMFEGAMTLFPDANLSDEMFDFLLTERVARYSEQVATFDEISSVDASSEQAKEDLARLMGGLLDSIDNEAQMREFVRIMRRDDEDQVADLFESILSTDKFRAIKDDLDATKLGWLELEITPASQPEDADTDTEPAQG